MVIITNSTSIKVINLSKNNYAVGRKLSNNKIAHITYSNIKIPRLKILHWNKGNCLFKNKLDDLYFVLDKYKPHIVSLSETKYDNNDRILIPDRIEANDLGVGHNISRQLLSIQLTIHGHMTTLTNI